MSNFWKAVLTWRNTVEGVFGQNVLHFEDTSAVKTAEQIGAIIDDSFWGLTGANGELRNFTSTNVVLTTISLQKLKPDPASGTIPFTTTQRAGLDGSAVRHPCLCTIFTLKDGGAGKRHRGRIYHYGLTQSKSDLKGPTAGNIAGTMSLWTANMITRFTDPASTGLILCLRHRGAGNGGEFTRVTSIRINPTFGIQRRRNYGVGF